MAKVRVGDYIGALQALLAEGEARRGENFDGFLRLLAANRQLHLLPQILDGLRARLDVQAHHLRARVHAPADLSARQREQITTFLQQQFSVDSVELDTITDLPGGGVIIEAHGERLDWSLARQVERFRQAMQTV